jgi:hypothetical protein
MRGLQWPTTASDRARRRPQILAGLDTLSESISRRESDYNREAATQSTIDTLSESTAWEAAFLAGETRRAARPRG